MARERTFFMVKPDGVHRSLIGKIVSRIEEKGYKISAMKMLVIDSDKASLHYAEHREKTFFDDLVSFITSGPVVAMVVEGDNVIEGVRTLMGMTDPRKSSPGTIRGDMAVHLSRNVVHGSDSPESAKREISIFFDEDEIIETANMNESWVYP